MSTATAFNKFGNAIHRNSVNGMSNTRRNQGEKAVKTVNLPPESFSDGQIANTIGKHLKNNSRISRWDSETVANNQFIAQATRNLYAGKQTGSLDNSLPMSFLPDTQPYEREVNKNLIGNSFNESSGYGMKIENLTNLTTPQLDKEWLKKSGIIDALTQTNPFPITINPNIKESLKQSLHR